MMYSNSITMWLWVQYPPWDQLSIQFMIWKMETPQVVDFLVNQEEKLRHQYLWKFCFVYLIYNPLILLPDTSTFGLIVSCHLLPRNMCLVGRSKRLPHIGQRNLLYLIQGGLILRLPPKVEHSNYFYPKNKSTWTSTIFAPKLSV